VIYDRSTQKLVGDNTFGKYQTHFLYSTVLGRMILAFVSSKTYSKLSAIYNNSKHSVEKIPKIEKLYHIDSTEYDNDEFESFNDFFTRKLKSSARPFSHETTDFVAPADAKMLYKHISNNLTIQVKNGEYSMERLVDNKELAKKYLGGECLIFRLTIDDCHRYIFPDDGVIKTSRAIKGKLHTVQAIAHKKYQPYISNYRVVSGLKTKHFGDIVFVEIGAMLVGKIRNHPKKYFSKGDEKGYFELGGSTIIILLEQNTIDVDGDILYHSRKNVETTIKQGETIGKKHA
jgi:phosphatidylserine decarboxylase